MAIYKIFPTKDTTLYSEYLSMNTGLDAILEASNVLDIAGIPVVSRYLIEFDTPEIEDIITNKISGSSFDVFLKNSISTAQGINADIDLEIFAVAQSWNNGTGHYLDSPIVQPVLKYYSVDTNTIYPPQLEFRWRDYSQYDPLSIVTTTQLKLSLDDNPGEFHPSSVNRFYVNVSPLYPTRTYKTSSLFTDTNYLPTSSFYAVKDLSTNEFVINFDDQYTQISSDERGNYFDVYMSGLEPERYYKILIKTNINGSVLILDDDYYFKVING